MSCDCSPWRVTEPTTGTDTTKLKTTAVKKGDRYVVNGQKVWISRLQHSDLMILLARTTPVNQVTRKSEGMSIFIVDLHQALGKGLVGAADSQHGESRDQRAVLRQPGDSRREPDRRGGQGLQVHPRWPECGAHADRGGMHRRWLLVRRARDEVRERAHRVRPADRQEPGRAVSDRRSRTWRSRRRI